MGYQDYYKKQYGGGGYRRMFSDEGGGDNDSRMKPWWERELDSAYEFDDNEYKGRSVSSTREILGHWGSYTRPTGDDVVSKLERVGCEVVRLMNSVRNSDSNDKVLSVKWAKKDDGDCNYPHSNNIVLSPDLIVGADGKANNHDNPEIVDAVGGQALMASTLKRTSEIASYIKAEEDDKSKVVEAPYRKEIWKATETAIAKQELLSEWPGAAAYLHRHQHVTSASAQEVEKFVTENADNMAGVSAAVSWKLNNPRTPIKMPGDMETHVKDVCNSLVSSPKDTRYEAVSDEVEKLKRWYKLPENNPPPTPPPSGAGSEPPPAGGTQPPPPAMPKTTDGSLFGEKVGSSHDKVPDSLRQDEDLEKFDKPMIPSGCTEIKGMEVRDPTKTPISTSYGKSNADEVYTHIARHTAQITQAIVGSLRFRATEPKFPVHGLFSGDLDDGSLYKLGVRGRRSEEQAVFERGEVQAIPDVAVGLLLDESGSMSVRGDGRMPGPLADDALGRMRRSNGVRALAVAMTEAFTRLKGLKLSVYGHSHNYKGVKLYEYMTDKIRDKTRISHVTHRGDNADGFAIMHVMRKMAKSYPQVRQKYLFVLSDGLPCASSYDGNYGGLPAIQHINNTCQWGLRKFGIRTFGFGIDGSPDQTTGDKMYGKGHFVAIDHPLAAAGVISKFLARVTTKV